MRGKGGLSVFKPMLGFCKVSKILVCVISIKVVLYHRLKFRIFLFKLRRTASLDLFVGFRFNLSHTLFKIFILILLYS